MNSYTQSLSFRPVVPLFSKSQKMCHLHVNLFNRVCLSAGLLKKMNKFCQNYQKSEAWKNDKLLDWILVVISHNPDPGII